MTPAKRLQHINEYYFSQKLREIDALNKQGRAVINLGIGSPDLPPHPDVVQTLHEEVLKPHQHAYQSYKGAPALRAAITGFYSYWYGVALDPDTEILPLIGSKEGIVHICMTYLGDGDAALVPNPGYPTYRSAVQLAGAAPIDYHLQENNQWFPDFNELEQLIKQHPNIKILFANYPHMPTGQLPSQQVFEQLVSFAQRHGLLIVHDNPYSFIRNPQPKSILSVPGAKAVALELNSLSKSSNMAGWRVGMLCGSAAHISEVLRFKSNMDSGMFLPVQLAAAKALQLGADWYTQLNNIYTARQQRVWQLLDTLGCVYDKNQAGLFVWARVPAHYADGYALSDEILYNKNVFLTPGGIFGSNGNAYIRISLCQPEAVLQQAIARMG
jgi:aspartate/methionine/tyrosine aminotransferase